MSPTTRSDASTSSQKVELDKDRIAEAVAKRQETVPGDPSFEDDQDRDLRQNFRRLIDPGILRPNSKETFIASLNILSTIAGNLLKEPGNAKYQRFKPTNTIIKTNLVEVPGALEYAIAMGFRAEVENFQPYYTHSNKFMRELRIGAAMIAEALERENVKSQRAAENSAREKDARKGVAEKVKLNYLDDRREKRLRDDMERQRRQALLEQAQRRAQAEAASEEPKQETESHDIHDTDRRSGSGEETTDSDGPVDVLEETSETDPEIRTQ